MTYYSIKINKLIFLVIIFTLPFLSACKEEEKGRILIYDKGNYLGPVDEKLNSNKIYNLQKHTNRQSDIKT